MSRVGNGTGPVSVRVSRAQDFEVFDQLPPQVRWAMSQSWFNRTAVGVRPQIASVGADRVALLLAPGGACDQHTIREERRQAEQASRIREVLGVRYGRPD